MSGRNIMAYLQFVRETRGDILKHQEALENEAELKALRVGFSYQQLSDAKVECCRSGGNYLAVLKEAIIIRKKEGG